MIGFGSNLGLLNNISGTVGARLRASSKRVINVGSARERKRGVGAVH